MEKLIMSTDTDVIQTTLQQLEQLTCRGESSDNQEIFCSSELNTAYGNTRNFIDNIILLINKIVNTLKKDENILISVKYQKTLRKCFQIVVSLGMYPCLLPGVGIPLEKRCSSANKLPAVTWTDTQKYELLVECITFFSDCYSVPVLKNIIFTLHLQDYITGLIQLAFAPLKKPGSYTNFHMTPELYKKLTNDKVKFAKLFQNVVTHSFQPIVMKELLALQSSCSETTPMFFKRVVSKELSNRLIAPGGLLSLIRCFIESYSVDTGYDWKKVQMISKIIASKHGTLTEEEYLKNICLQIKQIMVLNNKHYLSTAAACSLALHDKYKHHDCVQKLVTDLFFTFDYKLLLSLNPLPGTIVITMMDIEKGVNFFHAWLFCSQASCPADMLTPNLYLLFQLGLLCDKQPNLKTQLNEIVQKCLSICKKEEIQIQLKHLLFGMEHSELKLVVEQYDASLVVKCINSEIESKMEIDNVPYIIELIKSSKDKSLVVTVFEGLLKLLTDLSSKRHNKVEQYLFTKEDEPVIFDELDKQYGIVLQILSEISTMANLVSSLNNSASPVLDFVEYFLNSNIDLNEECVSVALVLLNTILATAERTKELEGRCASLIPALNKISSQSNYYNTILCSEALDFLSSSEPRNRDSNYEKALSNVFDDLLPTRAHGIMELTKLIEMKDPETLSKKHYVFCLFQEQLKESDSYIYLAAINAIAALAMYCSEEVLQVLCKEFLQSSIDQSTETLETMDKISKLRMKIADIIVKVTKNLGEMAIPHKTLLLNTMLCACRDDDPLIRTSALSNLAEIALVIHYRIGSIIYELLLCIWNIVESDKAVECRRAAVMIFTSLFRGLGKDTLLQLKDNILPIYRSLKNLYRNNGEDDVVRLHAQLALEELNEIVNESLFPELKLEKQIFILD